MSSSSRPFKATVMKGGPKAGPGPIPADATLERIAWLMDQAIVIPGTNIRVGLDALLGLLPVGGDVMTGLIQAGLVLFAISRYRLPKAVAARMVTNVLLDVGVGAIPIVGDVFDVFFKANTRNMALLREVHAHEARGEAMPAKASTNYLLWVGVLLGAALVLVLAGFVALIVWISKAAGRGAF